MAEGDISLTFTLPDEGGGGGDCGPLVTVPTPFTGLVQPPTPQFPPVDPPKGC